MTSFSRSARGWFRRARGEAASQALLLPSGLLLFLSLCLVREALLSGQHFPVSFILCTALATALIGTGLLTVWWRGFRRRSVLSRQRQRFCEQLAEDYDHRNDAVLAIEFDSRILYLNNAAVRLIGISADNACGQAIDAVLAVHGPGPDAPPLNPFDPFDRRFYPDATADVASPAELPVLRSRVSVVDGIPVIPRVFPFVVKEGLRGLILILSDGRPTQQASRRQAHALAVADATVDAIIQLDKDGCIREWNEGARRLFAYEAHEVLGESVTMLVGAERQSVLLQSVEAARSGERLSDRDLVVHSRDGREFDVSLAAFALYPLPTDGAVADAIVVVLRDIQQRRIGERRVSHLGSQLVRRAQELQAIFDIAPVGMVIADSPDCRHVRPNRALARVLGVDRTEELNLAGTASYAFWLDGRPMRIHESPLHAAVASRSVIEPMELEIHTAQGSSTVMAYGAPVIDQDNAVVGAIAVFVDISAMKTVHAERQRLLAEAITARRVAEEASRLKEDFLATVSHELRTPLNAIQGWLEIMQRKPDAATQARGLDVIRRNVKAQTRVIEDILDVSAFVTGKARLIVRHVDLVDIARACVESMRPTAETKGVNLSFSTEIPTAWVNGDAERLQQVIWNLLSNAVKFTPTGGAVSAGIRHDDAQGLNRFALCVRDTGEGIDASFLPYVFDRFRQADSSIERRHSGLGLGLAIVRHLSELHGGSVAVESPGPGLGATFCVHLPAKPGADAQRDNTNRHGPSGVSEPLSQTRPVAKDGLRPRLFGVPILVVEDDAAAAELLANALSDEGAEVSVADNVEIGLALLRNAPREFAAVLSDIGMPGRDGYALIRELRLYENTHTGRPRARPIFAMAVTAYARPEDREKALASGFNAYLVKPVSPERVTTILHERLAELGAVASPVS